MIDQSQGEDVESLSSDQFPAIVDSVLFCDMCFMTKCPYVPPHEFNIDFPHLMLRYRSLQKKERQLARTPRVLANTDRNGKIGVFFSSIINWFSNIKINFLES